MGSKRPGRLFQPKELLSTPILLENGDGSNKRRHVIEEFDDSLNPGLVHYSSSNSIATINGEMEFAMPPRDRCLHEDTRSVLQLR